MSQPLMMIFALIVGALILFFGVRMVYDLTKYANQVHVSSYANDLKNKIEEYHSLDPGSKETITIRLPNKVEALCIKHDSTDNNINFKGLKVDPDSQEVIKINKQNFFFIPIDVIRNPTFTIPDIELADGKEIICIKNRGELIIKSAVRTENNKYIKYVELSSPST